MSISLIKEKSVPIAVLMTFAIFMVDLFTPLWYDVWVLYLIPLFFMYQSSKRPYVYSAIVTLLIAAGLFLASPDSTPLMHSAVNRITGIFGGWGVSMLLMRLKQLHVSLLQSHNELENRVEERTVEKEKLIVELRKALANVKQLSGLLPICASCKRIRDDKGYWTQIESYIHEHSEAEFTHGICPECAEEAFKEVDELKKSVE